METALERVYRRPLEYETQPLISQDVLLHLMEVSSLWETKITSNPLLWVDIILDNEYGTAAKAAIAIHYSKQVPISLYIADASIWWTVESLQEALIINKDRIRAFSFLDEKIHLAKPMLVQLLPMPLLESIVFTRFWDTEAITSFLKSIPRPLKAVQGVSFDVTILKCVDISQLRSLYLRTDSDHFLDLLDSASRLEELVIVSRGRYGRVDIPKSSYDYQKPLRWKSLHFTQGKTEAIFRIFYRLSNLMDLEIGVNGKVLPALLLRLGEMERLAKLKLVFLDDWSDFYAPTTPHLSKSVNILGLTIIAYDSRLDQNIADLLFLCCPNTTQLSLWASSKDTIPIYASVSGFKSLKTMELIHHQSYESEIRLDTPVSFVDSLESLTYLASSEVLKLILPQQIAKVKQLTVDLIDEGELALDPRRSPDLDTLKVSTRVEVVWGPGTFAHLTFISVYGSHNPRTPAYITGICRDIVLHQNALPSLCRLRLEICPEWDILLILLVRRNIRSTQGISAITTLEIPTRCPPRLIECFKAIVKGVPVKLPTSYELSLAGTFEIAQDPSIPGCVRCHRALKYCEGGRTFLQVNRPPPPFERIEYPEDESEILQTWVARANQWYPFEDAVRSHSCSERHGMITLSR